MISTSNLVSRIAALPEISQVIEDDGLLRAFAKGSRRSFVAAIASRVSDEQADRIIEAYQGWAQRVLRGAAR